MGVLEVRSAVRPSARIGAGILLVLGGFVAFPLIWMMVGSFRPVHELMHIPPMLIPRSFTVENYVKTFYRMPVLRYFFNSSFVAIVHVTIVLFTSSFTGHIFSKYDFAGKEIIFFFFIGTIMIPFYSFSIPLWRLVSAMRLANTYVGIFGPWLVEPFGIFLMRQFMHEIPREVVDSARIDGASEMRIYVGIVLPLSKSALGVLGIIIFVWSWNAFFWPLVVITQLEMYTLPVAIATFLSNWTAFPETGVHFALGSIMMVPLVVMYIVFHGSFTKSIALSGLK